ncbi:hypothetical protein [Brevifollis gellanilyticus]|nr:hypothetical protein [Brevifollis gellanilyticus]
MSLDYPEYVELKKRKRWFLALLWRLGDIGYYVGLLGALIGPLSLLGGFTSRWMRSEPTGSFWGAVLCVLTVFAGFVLLLVLSGELKAYALKRGRE